MLTIRDALLKTSTVDWLYRRMCQTGMERFDLFNDLALLPAASGGYVEIPWDASR